MSNYIGVGKFRFVQLRSKKNNIRQSYIIHPTTIYHSNVDNHDYKLYIFSVLQ